MQQRVNNPGAPNTPGSSTAGTTGTSGDTTGSRVGHAVGNAIDNVTDVASGVGHRAGLGAGTVAGTTTGTARGSAAGATAAGRTQGTLSQSGGAKIVGTQSTDPAGPGPHVMAASTLTRDKVMNHAGETLGDLDEIMIDVPRGRVAYAVLSAGGFLGMGEKLFAIPWSALSLDTDNKCFILDIDRDRLMNAPGFDRGHWPSEADQDWSTQVHSYYNARPYWD